MERAHAPPSNICLAIREAGSGSRIFPKDGEAYFISEMIGFFLHSEIASTSPLRCRETRWVES